MSGDLTSKQRDWRAGCECNRAGLCFRCQAAAEIERLQKQLALAESSARQMHDAWNAACHDLAERHADEPKPQASKERFKVVRDSTLGLVIEDTAGEFSRMTAVADSLEKLQRICDMLNGTSAKDSRAVEVGDGALRIGEIVARAIFRENDVDKLVLDEPETAKVCAFAAQAVFDAHKRTADEPSGDLAIARNCLGNLYVAVENLGRVPSVPRDPDVMFAMREAAQFLGPPYTALTKEVSPTGLVTELLRTGMTAEQYTEAKAAIVRGPGEKPARPEFEIELPDGDTRKVVVWFVEQRADGKWHISVSVDPEKSPAYESASNGRDASPGTVADGPARLTDETKGGL